jgi:DNA invertase Pin-like site-specific DNA recombinase
MLERQREGIAKAKAEGKFKGRAPTAQRKSAEVIRMWSAGTKPPEIVEALGISLSSVYRIIRSEQVRRVEAPNRDTQEVMAA